MIYRRSGWRYHKISLTLFEFDFLLWQRAFLIDKLITKDFFIIEEPVTIGENDVKFMIKLLHLLQLYAIKAVIGQQVVYFLFRAVIGLSDI